MMPRQRRRIYLPLVGTILLCILVGVYLTALKRHSKQGPPAKIIKHTVETPSDEILKYWTADKMRNARPVTMPNTNALRRKKKQPPHPPDVSSSPNA